MSKTVLSSNKYKILIFLIFIPVILFSQNQVNKEEVRALWLHYSKFSMDKKQAIQQIQKLFDKYAEIGINNLFCYSTMKYQHKRKWDYLKVLIDEAHKRDIKIHPTFCLCSKIKIQGEIKKHPEWLIRGMNGEIYPYLNIANPEARKYLVNKISGALKYDIDGIHLDYVRYPLHQRFSYDKYTCEAFKKEYGYSPMEIHQDCGSMIWCEWIKWNAKQVTMLVREIKKMIDKSGKHLVLGADVFPDYESAKILIAQDWELWAKEGILDFICPMLYTNDTNLFKNYVKKAVSVSNEKCSVYAGIGINTSHNKITPEGLVQEVKIARRMGAKGVSFFSGNSLNDKLMKELKSTVFKK